MLRFGILVSASALALVACGDVVQFPGAKDVPVTGAPSDPDTPTPEPVSEEDPVIPAPDGEVTDPEPQPTETDPLPGEEDPTDPTSEPAEGETSETDPGTETDPEVDPNSETDPDAEPGTDTETLEPTPASGINNLLEVNAQICAASGSPTMTVAEVAGAGPPESTFGTAVVNGSEADRADYPGIVKLEPKRRIPGTTRTSSGHCSATRIADQWFITAAHCLDSEYDEVTIVAGVNRLNDPSAVRLVAETTICHSSYGSSAEEYANDIALIKMAPEAVEFLQDVPIAKYGLTEKLLGATNYPTVDMAGWGLTSFNETISNELLQATLKTNNVGPAIISIASLGGSGPCVGDSGGPLYVTEGDGSKVLVGMLSVVENNLTTGKFCEGQYNGRYTNLQGFLPWVNAVMGVCDAEGGDALCVDG